MSKLRVACVQTNPQEDVSANLERAYSLVRQAAREGAEVVALPEVFAFMGSNAGRLATSSRFGSGVFAELSNLAKELGIVLVGGSHAERAGTQLPEKVFNTSAVFDAQGRPLSVYRKMHLFNLRSPTGETLFCESDVFLAGGEVAGFDLPSAEGEWHANVSICYDLRFPEIFRQSSSRDDPWDVIFLPAAFVHQTGQHHWEVLLRARAIENQCFVVACNQTGAFLNGKKRNYGHSMVVGPWGQVLAELGEEEGILHCTLDSQLLEDSRSRLSALNDRRL